MLNIAFFNMIVTELQEGGTGNQTFQSPFLKT